MKIGNTLITIILSLCFSQVLLAQGVIEINQARAMAGGVTQQDTPGFPVTLSEQGSYKLTGNLDLRLLANADDLSAILIESDNIWLDMNGFQIIGPNNCTGGSYTLTCTYTGGAASTGDGIDYASNHYEGLFVQNGEIIGMGGNGMVCYNRCRLENMVFRNNGGTGAVLTGGRVFSSQAEYNYGTGFVLNSMTIKDSQAFANRSHGIDAQSSVIRSSNLAGNGYFGVQGHAALQGQNTVYNQLFNNTIHFNGLGLNGATADHNMNLYNELVTGNHCVSSGHHEPSPGSCCAYWAGIRLNPTLLPEICL